MTSKDISEFLTSRRAKVTPEQAGLPAYGTNRRVSGLRREEVALLAGISVEYYTRLERGSGHRDLRVRPRRGGIGAAARRRRADAPPEPGPSRRRAERGGPSPSGPHHGAAGLQRVLDSMAGAPAYVRNGRSDILSANALGRALYAPIFDMGEAVPNVARYVFLSPTAPDFFTDFDRVESEAVAILRAEAGRDPLRQAAHRARR